MISSVSKLTSDMQGMNHDWQQVISCKILQFFPISHIITQKPHGSSYLYLVLIFLEKRETIPRVFVGEKNL